jgi:hypothetical protein
MEIVAELIVFVNNTTIFLQKPQKSEYVHRSYVSQTVQTSFLWMQTSDLNLFRIDFGDQVGVNLS